MKTCETCKHFSQMQGAGVCTSSGITLLVQIQRSEKLGACGHEGKKWESRHG